MHDADRRRPAPPAERPVGGSPSDNTDLVAILAALAEEGFDADLTAVPDGALRCGRCGTASAASAFPIDRVRRLEGASDPDDMQLVVAATCPACGARGTAVLAFGPQASEVDADVVVALP